MCNNDLTLLIIQNNNICLSLQDYAEGTKFAYVESVVFVDGAAYPFPNSASSFLGPLLCDDRVVTLDLISRICPSDFDITVVNSNAAKFVHAFIEAGYFYPVYK